MPIMALTATANKITVDDILQRLKLRDCVPLIQSFNRQNLNYSVAPKQKNVIETIGAFIKDKHPNETGVIYCLGRNMCENVAKQLREKGFKAKHYHALLHQVDKERTQADWKSGKCHIIVATVSQPILLRNFVVDCFFVDCFWDGHR